MKRLKAGGLAVLALAAAPATAGVKEGIAAWQQGDYAAAVAQWRPAAAAGDADAEFNLAQAYKLGHGVPQDLGQAKALYYEAALQGHPQAEANYGLMLFQAGDRAGAMPWLQKASILGEPRAQYVVGTALFNGDLAGKDWPRAYAYMTRAAAAGLPQAANSLAQMDRFMPLPDRQKGITLAQALAQPTPSVAAAELTSAAPGGGAEPSRIPTGTPGIESAALPPSAAPDDQQAAAASAWGKAAKGKKGKKAGSATPAPEPAPAPAVVFAQPQPVPTANFNPPVSADQEPPMQAAAPAPIPPSAPPPPAPPIKAARKAAAPAQLAKSAGGRWRIQLGAFASAAAANAAWRSAGLGGLDHYAVAAAGMTKLQAGPFASREEAARACAKAKSGCFVVAP